MSTPALAVEDAGISFGGVRAIEGVSFRAEPGQVLSIIGPNGAGKTTLFNVISGIYRADQGRVSIGGAEATGLRPAALARLGLSRTFQNLQIFTRMTALENVLVGRHLRSRQNVFAHLCGITTGDAEARHEALALLGHVGLAGAADETAGALSYGAMKRLEIARALAAEPKVLLLDEPAAGCNAVETEEIDRLLIALSKSGLAIVLVEHDMKLVMSISDKVLVLDQGRVLMEGPPETVVNDRRVIEAYLGAAAKPATSQTAGSHAAG